MKNRVTLQTPINTADSEGIVTKAWQDGGNISVTLLPITQGLALKEHGYEEKVEKRAFYKGQNTNIKLGNRVIVNQELLYIVSVLDYGKVTDFLLAKQVPGVTGNG